MRRIIRELLCGKMSFRKFIIWLVALAFIVPAAIAFGRLCFVIALDPAFWLARIF